MILNYYERDLGFALILTETLASQVTVGKHYASQTP